MPLTCLLNTNYLVVSTTTGFALFTIDSNTIHNVQLPTLKCTSSCDESINTHNQPNQPNQHFFISSIASNNHSSLAIADCHKRIFIYNHNSQCNVTFKCFTSRKIAQLLFTNDSSNLLMLDRTGDVFIVNLKDDSNCKPVLLLGHLSVLLDMKLTIDNKFIITCDRDEKIRISNFPNSYNIHTYCLGHEEFVSSICIFNVNTLISGSGDKSLRLWNIHTGKQLARYDCQLPVKQIVLIDSYLLVNYYCGKILQLFRVENDNLIFFNQIELTFDVLEMHSMQNNRIIIITSDSTRPIRMVSMVEKKELVLSDFDLWNDQSDIWTKLINELPKDEASLKFMIKNSTECA